MDVLQSSQELIEEELIMFGSKIIISLDDLMEIRFHQLKDNINISEFPSRWRQHYMLDLHYVRMAQQPEELDLPQNARGVGHVFENVVYLLDGDPLPSVDIHRRPHHAIASLAHHLLDLVLGRLAILREELVFRHAL